MPIDLELRKTGVSASEVAAVLGLSPWQTPFDIYISKTADFTAPGPSRVQLRGKALEKGVIEFYQLLTGRPVEFFDQTVRSASRPWQLASPDAWLLENAARVAEVQAKTVHYRARESWGESGSDDIPEHVFLQSQWTMSTVDTEFTDIAALMSMDDLAIYRVYRDRDLEATLLEEVERWFKAHVLARVAPPIEDSELTREYIRQRWPKHVEPLRVATEEERVLMRECRLSQGSVKTAELQAANWENRLKAAIGDGEGLLDGNTIATYRRSKDQVGVDYEALARELLDEQTPDERKRLMAKHRKVLQRGSRRLVLR